MQEAKIVKGKDGKLKLENFYTPLEEAKKEIWRRWNDKELKKRVEDFWNEDIPDFLKKSPKAYLARHLSTPDKEFSRFLELSKKLELSPICPEILSDKFSAKNSDKYYLGKLFFHDGKGKNGGDKISTLKIIDYCTSEGEKISSLRTTWGENLVDFHHTILKAAHPEIDGKNPDLSSWISGKRKTLNDFYKFFLSFFLCHAVLLESFVAKEEKSLIENFVLPQFNLLWQKYRKRPIIVRLLPQNSENDRIWCCHSESMKKLLRIMVAL